MVLSMVLFSHDNLGCMSLVANVTFIRSRSLMVCAFPVICNWEPFLNSSSHIYKGSLWYVFSYELSYMRFLFGVCSLICLFLSFIRVLLGINFPQLYGFSLVCVLLLTFLRVLFGINFPIIYRGSLWYVFSYKLSYHL